MYAYYTAGTSLDQTIFKSIPSTSAPSFRMFFSIGYQLLVSAQLHRIYPANKGSCGVFALGSVIVKFRARVP